MTEGRSRKNSEHQTESGTKESHFLMVELRKARRSTGCSQEELAQRIGKNVRAIQRLEKGIGSVRTLIDAMKALDFVLAGIGPGRTACEQLKKRRSKRSWSLKSLSKKTGLSCTTIRGLEKGEGTVASFLRVLDALAPNAKRRAPERVYMGTAKKEDRDVRFTPADFMANIYDAFGPVDLDPCGNERSPVIARRIFLLSQGDDGLRDDWSGTLAFVNPPYSEQTRWLRRAIEQWRKGKITTVLALVPTRTDSQLFHEILSEDADVFLLQGRIKFADSEGNSEATPHSLMIVALGASDEQKSRFDELVRGQWISGKRRP